MIKQILLLVLITLTALANVIKEPVISLDKDKNIAIIAINHIDIGVSGFITHKLAENNSVILKNVNVIDFDKETHLATLQMSDFNKLRNNALPNGKWKVEVGDMVSLAFGYNRAVLIAPTERIYYRITKATKNVQWLHPDIYTTILSFTGHPTPLKQDFINMANATSVGIFFFYLNQKLLTVDALSMKVLNISDAPLEQKDVKLPFYSRIETIEANWFGAGSDELESYEPYYYKLLIEANPKNKELEDLYTKFKQKK